MHILPIIILFLSGVVLTAGDIFFRTWTEKGLSMHTPIYFVGLFLYIVGSMLLVESYRHSINIVSAGLIQILFNTIILVVFTYFYFHEPLTNLQIVGVFMGIASIFLIQ
jgi:drug/metabolite transporter (DMT)-like permease